MYWVTILLVAALCSVVNCQVEPAPPDLQPEPTPIPSPGPLPPAQEPQIPWPCTLPSAENIELCNCRYPSTTDSNRRCSENLRLPDPTEQMPINLTIGFLGDQGVNDNAAAVLRMLQREGVEAILHAGDFDYQSNPGLWESQINSVLGPNYPYFAAIGNHDSYNWPGYSSVIADRYTRMGAKCWGDVGRDNVCSYKGFVFAISGVGTSSNYDHVFIAQALDAFGGMWRGCLWHKNQRNMQLGDKSDETGYQVYNTCNDRGALIITGHEHSYSRTKQMYSYGVTPLFGNATIDSATGKEVLELRPGASVAMVTGVAGASIRPCTDGKEKNPWWASTLCTNSNPPLYEYGAVICKFNYNGVLNLAYCEMKTSSGAVMDSFTLRSSIPSTVTNTVLWPPTSLPVPPSPLSNPFEPPCPGGNDVSLNNYACNPSDPSSECMNQSPNINTDQMPVNLTLAFLGDQGIPALTDGNDPAGLLELILAENVSAIFHAGDFDYTNNATAWETMLTSVLGEDFPYFSAVGNHDQIAWNDYKKVIKSRYLKFGANCFGDVGRDLVCSYKGFTFVTSGVGTSATYNSGFFSPAFNHFGGIWRACVWHKNHHNMQLGDKGTEVSAETYRSCLAQGAFIITGHEHSYARSRELVDFGDIAPTWIEGTSAITWEVPSVPTTVLVNVPKVTWSSVDVLRVGQGKSWATVVGVAGRPVRGCTEGKDGNPWWSSTLCEPRFQDSGALICKLNLNGELRKAYCYFKSRSGSVHDTFYMYSQNNLRQCSSPLPSKAPTGVSPGGVFGIIALLVAILLIGWLAYRNRRKILEKLGIRASQPYSGVEFSPVSAPEEDMQLSDSSEEERI